MTDQSIVEQYRSLMRPDDDGLVHQDHVEPLIAHIEKLEAIAHTRKNRIGHYRNTKNKDKRDKEWMVSRIAELEAMLRRTDK